MAREGIARDAIKHLARHSSSAADGYIEEAAEECPSSGMVAMDQMGVARRLENLASVQFGIQRELAATREGQISVEDVERLVRDQIAQSVPALSMSAGSLSPEDVKLLVQDAVAGLVPAQASVPMAVIESAIDERVARVAAKPVNPSFVYNPKSKKIHRIIQCDIRLEPDKWITSCGWTWFTSHNPTRLLFQLNEAPAEAVKCVNCS